MTSSESLPGTAETMRASQARLSHLSIEVGHLSASDFAAGAARLIDHFRQVAPWVRAAEEICSAAVAPRSARVSTCFLIDDYFTRFRSPREVLPQLLEAAAEAGIRIDYVARESACAKADGVDVAGLVESQIVPDPAPLTDGRRPSLNHSGWLCNGERSPTASGESDAAAPPWQPPRENTGRRHSIFLDVQLWDDDQQRRVWSCPYLAAIWQLWRLGVLRKNGAMVAGPRSVDAWFGDDWDQLPALAAVNSEAAPFCAYRTMSVLGNRYLGVEHAVRTILSRLAIDPGVAKQVLDNADSESVAMPVEIVDRIEYVFAGLLGGESRSS